MNKKPNFIVDDKDEMRRNLSKNSNEDYDIYILKEFEKNWMHGIDRRFAYILLGSFIVHFFTVFYFTLNPPKIETKHEQIKTTQERFARLILRKNTQSSPEKKRHFNIKDVSSTFETMKSNSQIKKQDYKLITSAEFNLDFESIPTEFKSTKTELMVPAKESRRNAPPASLDNITEKISSTGLLGMLSDDTRNSQRDEVAEILDDKSLSHRGKISHALSNVKGIHAEDSDGETAKIRSIHSEQDKHDYNVSSIDRVEATERAFSASANTMRRGEIQLSDLAGSETNTIHKVSGRKPEQISAVINGHNTSIQYCYQRELKRNPELKGKIELKITIGYNGYVKKVDILSSTINNIRVERCIIKKIERWDDFGAIPESKGDTIFRQVYTFGT